MSTVDPKLLGWIARVVIAGTLFAFVGMAVSQTSATAPNVASPVAQPASSPVVAAAATVAPTTQAAPAGDPTRTTFSLDNDLISTIRWLGWVVVGVLGVFAGLTLSFFGIDVRAVRKTLLETQDELRKKADEVRSHEKSLGELKERLEKLGAVMEDAVEKAKAAVTGLPGAEEKKPETAGESAPVPVEGPLSEVWRMDEKKKERLRNLIAASEFEWSTLGTLARKTGLPQSEVMALANNDPLIQRGIGRNSEVLFRLKEFNHLPGDVTKWEDWIKVVLQQHAEQGRTTVKSIFPE